ncbi:MAG: hypothetical protein ACLR4C_02040 [Eubacterium ventriosum]
MYMVKKGEADAMVSAGSTRCQSCWRSCYNWKN